MAKKVNVTIVEDHNEALSHIYRAIGGKKIPFSGLKLLHFDSHPDLGLPDIKCDLFQFEPQVLLRNLSIENWIMPAVFAGHIDHVIWMRPKWSNQMAERRVTDYCIGEERGTNKLSVNVRDSYFVHDGVFCAANEMVAPIHFSLSVATIHEAHTSCKTCSDIVFSLLNQPFIVDIDLDTFSTQDPFRDRFTSEQRELIVSLYGVEAAGVSQGPWASDIEAKTASLARREQLSQLGELITMIKKGEPLPEDNDKAQQLFTLCQSVKGHENLARLQKQQLARKARRSAALLPEDSDDEEEEGEEGDTEGGMVSTGVGTSKEAGDVTETGEETLDYLHYLWSGMDSDSESLPHQINTSMGISEMIGELESLLNRLHNPLLVTVSRSSTDGYTPADQVDDIQQQIINCLTRVYGDNILNFIYAYQKDDAGNNSPNNGASNDGRSSTPPPPQHSTRERRPIRGRRGIV